MLIPYSTDAPIYHGPWATIGFIVANVLAFLFMLAGTVDPEPLALEYGTLNPIQWLTSNFLHADLWHLVGNMVFLWAFGLVVEGKIGWGRFTAVYLGLGITQAGIEQICSLGLGQEGGSFGASAIVFGLMGMALVWAPSNEMQCLLLVRFRPIHFEISILVMSLLYVAVEFVLAFFSGLMLSSSVLHLMGGVLGFGLGTLMLKKGLVDCEHWDLYTVLAGRQGEPPAESKQEVERRERVAKAKFDARSSGTVQRLRELLESGQGKPALELHQKMAQRKPRWQLPEDQLIKLAAALNKERAWADSVPLMVEYLRRFPEKSARVRLQLAHVLLRHLNRPAQAMGVLSKIPEGTLDESLEQMRRQMVEKAEKQREQGTVELAVEDW